MSQHAFVARFGRVSSVISKMAATTLVVVCLHLLLLSGSATGKESYFTYVLRAGGFDCFTEELLEGDNVEIDYQVISGGDLDVNFYVAGPNPVGVVVSTHKEREGVHNFPIEIAGEYDICLDNSFSTFSEKTVYLAIYIYRRGEDEFQDLFEDEQLREELEEEVDVRVEIMKNSTDAIRLSLRQISAEQNKFRSREARHRYTADNNQHRVAIFSLVNMVVMATAAITQVVVLRRLFKDHRKDRIKT